MYSEFGLSGATSESDILEQAARYFQWLFFKENLVGYDSLNIELHPESESPFKPLEGNDTVLLTSEPTAPRDSDVDEAFKFMDVYETKSDNIFHFFRIVKARESFMRLQQKCPWTLSKVDPVSRLDMIRHLFAATLGLDYETFLPSRRNKVLIVYRSFDAWAGSHVLTFMNKEVDLDGSGPRLMSISLPIGSGQDFFQKVGGFILILWAVSVFILGMAVVWLTLKPLRTLAHASREASLIIQKKDSVSGRLESLAKGLHSTTPAIREYRILLTEMVNLLNEREEWLGRHLHQLKNDLLAISHTLPALQNADSDADSALEDIDKVVSRISSVINSVATYQLTLFGKPESKTLIDLDSVLGTILG